MQVQNVSFSSCCPKPQQSFNGMPDVGSIAKGLGYDIPQFTEKIAQNGKIIAEKVTHGIDLMKEVSLFKPDKEGNRILRIQTLYEDGFPKTSALFDEKGKFTEFIFGNPIKQVLDILG